MLHFMYILLVLMLISGFFIGKRDPFSPTVVFCTSFVFCCSWAVVFSKQWNLVLHTNTFNVITCGVFTYIISALFARLFMEKTKGKKVYLQDIPSIEIQNWVILICILFEIFVILLSVFMLRKITGFTNISNAINAYDQSVKFSDKPYNYPMYVNLLRRAVGALGYWFAYVFVSYYISNKKIKIEYFFVFSLSFVSQLLSGGRNASINMVIGLCAYFAYFSQKKKKFYKYHIPIKTFFYIIIILSVALLFFQRLGVIMGRDVVTVGINYIAGYCGAQIKNLDIFLQEPIPASEIWGSQTFINIINWVGPKVGILRKQYRLYLPFRRVNNINLGNVATTFMSFYYDFGFIGVIILTMIMALFTQILYESIKRIKLKKIPSISVIVYGYVFSSIVFSFFSNKFYEQNFTPTFFRYMLWWYFFNIIFGNINIRIKTKNIKIERQK